MNKEQLLATIQGGHLTDGDLADALLAELAKGAKHIRTAFLNKDGGVTLLMSRSDPSTHSEFKKYLYTSPLPQPDLVAEIEAAYESGYSAGYDACLEEHEGMTTEQKIREAFEKYKAKTIFPESVCEEDFRAGYLALLNSLELSDWVRDSDNASLYALPEGVEK